jgi:hypothetical protein
MEEAAVGPESSAYTRVAEEDLSVRVESIGQCDIIGDFDSVCEKGFSPTSREY